IVLRMIDNPGLCASVIPDAIHVSPPMFRLMHSALVPGQTPRVCYTTDAMSAADAPPGRYRIGKVETEVGADRIVRMPGKTNFAGSALRPIDGVFIAADMLRCSWRETWARASLGARRYAGLSLKQDGAPFCILNVEDNEFKHGRLFANGDAIEIRRTN
ncbi:MAG: N-acetylglucosamine-6-phosphate deacetylase, partial [Planctomycetota bacterium]